MLQPVVLSTACKTTRQSTRSEFDVVDRSSQTLFGSHVNFTDPVRCNITRNQFNPSPSRYVVLCYLFGHCLCWLCSLLRKRVDFDVHRPCPRTTKWEPCWISLWALAGTVANIILLLLYFTGYLLFINYYLLYCCRQAKRADTRCSSTIQKCVRVSYCIAVRMIF